MHSIERTHSASADDVASWCRRAGDNNKIHLDKRYASESYFGERVVPGVMALGWVSGALEQLGQVFGGDVILTDLESHFKNPIPLNTEVTVTVRASDSIGDKYTVNYTVSVGESIAINGEATIYVE